MIKISRYVVLVIMFMIMTMFSYGCAATKIEPISIPKPEFNKSQKFIVGDTINKPDKPDYIKLDSSFKPTELLSETKYFAFTMPEFSKIVGLSSAFDSQSKMLEQLVAIINIKIDEINALKELTTTQSVLSEHLSILYANEQSMRAIENRNYTYQKLLDRVFMVVQSGVIIALVVAL